jgi:hexokinase
MSDDILKQIMEIMEDEMERGLNRTTVCEADLRMLPTYVCQLPTGKESNDILALDLGGSNFRVLLIKLRENEQPQILNKVFIVSESIMKGTGDKVDFKFFFCLISESKSSQLFVYFPLKKAI